MHWNEKPITQIREGSMPGRTLMVGEDLLEVRAGVEKEDMNM